MFAVIWLLIVVFAFDCGAALGFGVDFPCLAYVLFGVSLIAVLLGDLFLFTLLFCAFELVFCWVLFCFVLIVGLFAGCIVLFACLIIGFDF